MKDLNRNEVYDLRGITHEQAEELLQWLIESDNGWSDKFATRFFEYNSIMYYQIGDITTWLFSNSEKPTTHISTVFEEKSYEEQLKEAVKRVEILKEKVNQLKEPKVGDVCMFHDGNIHPYVIGILTAITKDGDYIYYEVNEGSIYENATKLTQQEVIGLLYGAN